jgi:hypothetical protein
MAATQAFLPVPQMVENNDWKGIPLIRVRISGSPPLEELAEAQIQFRQQYTSNPPGSTLNQDNGRLIISSAPNWEMIVPQQKLPLKAGEWLWDLQTTDVTGVTKTYVYGTLVVLPTTNKKVRCA